MCVCVMRHIKERTLSQGLHSPTVEKEQTMNTMRIFNFIRNPSISNDTVCVLRLKDKIEMRKPGLWSQIYGFHIRNLGQINYWASVCLPPKWLHYIQGLFFLTFGEMFIWHCNVLFFCGNIESHHVVQLPFEHQCQVLIIMGSNVLKY